MKYQNIRKLDVVEARIQKYGHCYGKRGKKWMAYPYLFHTSHTILQKSVLIKESSWMISSKQILIATNYFALLLFRILKEVNVSAMSFF